MEVKAQSDDAKRNGETFVESFEKGLRVIASFDAQHADMTLSEVAERTGLTRAASRRLLLTLVELGYASLDDRRFRLTPRVLDLGFSYLRSSALPDVMRPILERITAELGESSSVAVLDDLDVVYVARSETNRILAVDLRVGARLPAAFTSMGRVLLAFDTDRAKDVIARSTLDRRTAFTVTSRSKLGHVVAEVRSKGWALVDQELEEGLRSIAVPLSNRRGQVVGAMNVSTQANRTTLDDMRRRFLPVLQRAAEEVRTLVD